MADDIKLISSNKKAFHDYQMLERFEAGIALVGTEVKSLRGRSANLLDAFCVIEGEEVFLVGCHIPPYEQGNQFNHDPKRKRRLLMHKREIIRLNGKVKEKGLTLIPTRLYFKKNLAKVEVALARGKRTHDKRQDIARRDADREMRRALSSRGRGRRAS